MGVPPPPPPPGVALCLSFTSGLVLSALKFTSPFGDQKILWSNCRVQITLFEISATQNTKTDNSVIKIQSSLPDCFDKYFEVDKNATVR